MAVRLLSLVPNYPPPVVGGLEQQAHMLNVELKSKGLKIQVVSNQHSGGGCGVSELKGILVKRSRFSPGRPFPGILNLLWTLGFLLRKHHRFDVVHIHNLSSIACFTAACCSIMGIPTLVKLPNVGRLGIPGLTSGMLGGVRVRLLRRAAGFVAMSTTSVEELHAIGVPDRKILKMVNGIDLEAFDRAANADTSKKIEDTFLRFIFVGRLMPQKGLDDLLDAWIGQHSAFVECKAELWIVGDGPCRKALETRIEKDRLQDQVKLLGHREDVPALLKQSDVFVLPSHSEGNSNAILEAMAAGLPVISTRISGTPMLVGPEGDEWLFDVGDVKVLKHVLMTRASDAAARSRIGSAMRERVETHFDIRNIAERYAQAYKHLHEAGDQSDLQTLAHPLFS